MAEDRNGRKKFKFGSSCIRRWATSMEEKGRERSTVNSRIDAFLRDHRSIVRMTLVRCSCTARPFPLFRSFQRPIPLPSTFRIPVPLSPFLSLSLSLSFLTMNFDKEPFFFTRKAPYFPLPAVPLPVEHLKEAIRGFRGSRRFVTLTLNLTRQEGIWSGKSWSSIKRVYVALWERNFWIYIFFWNKKKVDSLRKKCRNESNHLFVNRWNTFAIPLSYPALCILPLFDYTLVVSSFPSFCLRPEEFPLCRRQQDIVEYLEGSCRPAVDAFRPVPWIFHDQEGTRGLAIAFSRLLRVEESRGSSRETGSDASSSESFVSPSLLRPFPLPPFFLSWSVVIGACVIDRFLIKLVRF